MTRAGPTTQGGTPRAAPLGLGKTIRALGVETHDRVYDATLAVRCWRNLDHETGVATDLVQRDTAREQLDRALLRGVALIVRQRLTELGCTTGEVHAANLAFLETLLPWLDRAARARDPVQASALQGWTLDVPAALAALDRLFPCP